MLDSSAPTLASLCLTAVRGKARLLLKKNLNCLAMGRQAVGETGRRRKGELKLKRSGLSLFAVTFVEMLSVSLITL